MRIPARAVLPALVALAPAMAGAGLEICNDTDARQSVAIGYKSGDDWVSEGWWNFQPGACGIVVGGDLENRYYYLLSEARGWSFADENIVFCTRSDSFTIVGDADCEARGHVTGRFRKVDTGKTARHFSVSLAAMTGPQDAAGKGGEPVAPAIPASDPPGTHGEPYTSGTAIFQDCVEETEAPFCTFHADGTKFFVYDDGRTPAAVMRRLRTYLPGTPVVLSGDLAGIYDRTADIVLREIGPRPRNGWDATLEKMQGQWYSIDDPNAMFTVLGSERESSYDGAFTGLDYLSTGRQCAQFEGSDYLIARAEESGDILCYSIEDIGDRSMLLMYLPAANFLEYRKLD